MHACIPKTGTSKWTFQLPLADQLSLLLLLLLDSWRVPLPLLTGSSPRKFLVTTGQPLLKAASARTRIRNCVD